jgi:spore coat polysaccharide biosynthesis protein SpsF
MRLVVIVQARVGSSRLPGKVLLEAAGKPLLVHLLERILAASSAFRLVVATTTAPADDAIASLCAGLGVDVYRGDPTDLLDRHYRAALAAGADAVAKIPSDCILIDPGAIDTVIGHFLEHEGRFDYVSNLHPPTWPDGNDVEAFTIAALEEAWRNARGRNEREHTTPYFLRHPERFRIANVRWASGLDLSATHRFVLDYEEDYRLIRSILEALSKPGTVCSLDEILSFLDKQPDLLAVNERWLGDCWQLREAPEHSRSLAPSAPGPREHCEEK